VRCGWDRTARERIIIVVDKPTEEEIMTNNVVEAELGNGSLAIAGGGERTLLLLARNIQTRAQEDAAIDAEDILTQAEEANALDPVG
jgi:hypothetical protein